MKLGYTTMVYGGYSIYKKNMNSETEKCDHHNVTPKTVLNGMANKGTEPILRSH
jgi:hypothetical protein